MTISENPPAQRNRIEFIDALRGAAILAVALFHAFARWPELYAYGNKYADYPVFSTGIAGVNLFFMISGFVILMTLERCASFKEFMLHRWLRLFPAMLICSLFVFFSAGLFPERPAGPAIAQDLIPGLTFIADYVWQHLGLPLHNIEGAFWSLYVEVVFYIIFGAFYFCFGKERAIFYIFALYLLCLSSPGHINHHINSLMQLNWGSYGFFCAGSLFFLFYQTNRKVHFLLGLAVGLIAARSFNYGASLFFVLLFASAMLSVHVRKLLSNPLLLFVGFVSYPLYLIHENMMVAMIVKTGKAFPNMPGLAMPVLPILIVVLLAWIIARYVEPPVKKFIAKRLEFVTAR